MPLSRQPQQVDLYDTSVFPPEMDPQEPLMYRHNARHPGRIAYQVEQLFVPNPCAQEWVDITLMDIRFVGTLIVDHLTQRAIVTCHSASGEPSIVIPGASVFELAHWDSPMPANFGGDGHGWWKVAYVIPDAGDSVDFSSVTGSLRYATWFTCEGTLPTGSGSYGDGVAIIFTQDLEYTATFGSAHASASVSQAALPKDALFMWVYPGYRSIDDIDQEKDFHAADTSVFNHDYDRHNSEFIPFEPGGGAGSSIDFTTDNRAANDPVMTYTMQFDVTATASIFPGACRVVATAFGADLRALCE